MTVEARKIRLIMHLRGSGVTDTAVLSAIERVPREAFLPIHFQDQAYEDMALPIGQGQTISQPLVVARMTQELQVNDRQKVLEIGTGSGYQAAVLSRLCRRVYTIERHRSLLKIAQERFGVLRYHNITARVADGMRGWPAQKPFDRIIVTAGGGEDAPPGLLEQLAPGGIMVIPLADGSGGQTLFRIVRSTEGEIVREALWQVRFVPLLPDVASDTGTSQAPQARGA